MKRKTIFFLLLFALLMSISTFAMAASSGTYRDIDWTLDDNGLLTLGNGGTQTISEGYSGARWSPNSVKSVQCYGRIVCASDMKSFFYGHKNMVSADLSGFDTSGVILMGANNISNVGMFQDCTSLTSLNLSGWNTSNVTDMFMMFSGCNNLASLDVSGFDTSKVTSMGRMFENCKNLTVIDVSRWDTSKVTNMRYMFYNCSSLTSLNVSGFNTSNVINMDLMFYGCKNLGLLDVSGWDTSNVTNMYSMFYECNSLTSLDVSGFNTSKVTNIGRMFYYCSKVPSLDVSHWDTSRVTNTSLTFSGCQSVDILNVADWDMSHVTDMSRMFSTCASLTSLDVSRWNTSNVTNMSGMFYGCSSLTSVGATSEWDTGNVTNMSSMFEGCSSLTSVDVVSEWDTSHVTNIKNIFYGCSNLTSVDAVSEWDTGNVTNMNGVFRDCSSLTSVDAVSGWETSGVTDMSYMFNACKNLTSLDVLTDWDTSDVTTMQGMFHGCRGLTSLDISGFDTHNVVNMANMFCNCSSLPSLDVSHFDTSNVTDMEYMFNGCNRLSSLDVSKWNTGKVTDMRALFYDCGELSSLDVSNWDTSQVTVMSDNINVKGIFGNCSSLTSLDVATWDVSKVTNMYGIFSGCVGLTSLDLSGWNTRSVTTMSHIFWNCSNLASLDISGWNTLNVDSMSSMFYGCTVLSEITLGNKYKTFYSRNTVVLATPPSSLDGVEYTGKWIREDRSYGPYTPLQLRSNYDNEAMPGKWVWEPKPTDYTLRFSSASYPNAVGEMAQVTTSATNDYQLVKNQYALFGFAFDHWDDGNGHIYADQAIIPANTYHVGDVITLNLVMTKRDTSIVMQDGSFEFNLRADETAIFDPVPANTTYQVYEQTTKGWNLIYQSGNAGTIGSLMQPEAIFLNRYDPLRVTIRLAGTKLLDGIPAEADMFAFLLYEDGNLIDIVNTRDGGLIEFQPITYESAGTHNYTVVEAVGSDPAVVYDSHEEQITVVVTDDGEGNLSVVVTEDDDKILFENAYKPGKLVLQKFGTDEDDLLRDDIFYYEIQFFTANGQPYDLHDSEITYEEREDVTEDYPDLQPVEKPKYTLTVTQNYHGASGYVQSNVRTEELNAGDIFSLDWLGKPAADVTVADGEDFLLRSGSGWKGIMPLSDLNVVINYSNTYAVLDKSAVRSFAVMSSNFDSAVNLMHQNGTYQYSRYNSTDSDRGRNVDDGTTECVVQFRRGTKYDNYKFAYYWYTNANVIYMPEDCSYLFKGLGTYSVEENAEKFDLLNYVDSSRVVNMSHMFDDFGWKTLDVSNLNTDSVTDMSYMFNAASSLGSLDLSSFNTSNVTDMAHMFHGDIYLTELDLSSFDTSNVTNMSHMFYNCNRLSALDLSGFDTSNVTDMTNMYAFNGPSSGAGSLRSVILGEHNPFIGNGTSAVLPSPTVGMDYSNNIEYTGKWIHEDGTYGPYTSEELRDNYTSAMAGKWVWQVAPPHATISRSLWTNNVNSTGSSTVLPLRSATTFSRNTSYTSADNLPNDAIKIDDDTTNYSIYFWMDGTDAYWWSDADMVYLPANADSMFYQCGSLISLDAAVFDTSKTTSMVSMFSNCSSLISLDLSGWDTSNVRDMHYMFNRCSNIENINVAGWDTSKVTKMWYMFYYCNNLVSLDLSSFDTSRVTNMTDMFNGCRSLASLDVSGWNTSNVTDMCNMFEGCRSLPSLDISSFDTHEVRNMDNMFNGCVNLLTIYIGSDWQLAYLRGNMLQGCPATFVEK